MNGTMQATKSRNGTSSPNQNKNPKNRGSKTTDRASPRSPLPEKKLTSKVSEMESQLTQFQEELKKAKDELSSLESQKKQEAEESKKQISFLSAKLENSEQQLIELSDSEDARLQELRKLSQERDRSWQSELEALQKQHASDSTALSSAMNEIQRLKKQLETTSESARVEIQSLRIELSETLELVEKTKHQLTDAKESEARAFEVMSEAQTQLEAAKATAEVIRSGSLKTKEDYASLASELEQSKAQVNTLEKLVSQLQGDLDSNNAKNSTDELKTEIDSLKLEIEQLKSALDASEARYQNEYIQSTLQIRSAYEAVERVKLETGLKEAALVEELKKAKEAIDELKSDLASKQNNHTSEMESELTEMKSALLDKETQRSTKFGELLDTTQMEKAELEVELKKLKVQADQWRKAAEAAAAILSPDAKVAERTVSVDTIGMKMDSPFSDNMEDDSPKKKNANMLKKIGGLWKKGQK